MKRLLRRALLASLLATACALVAPGLAPAAGPLQTAVAEHSEFEEPDTELALRRIRAAGATAFRLDLAWYSVAPVQRPDVFRPEDPADPAYRWSAFDEKLRMLKEAGLEPIVAINYPPQWGKGGASTPVNIEQFALFSEAAARRYTGAFQNLPRVRYWQIWIEPNVNKFFRPQFIRGRPASPAIYRRLVNASATAIHRVRSGNIVIAGGLSPFTVRRGETHTIGPLRFMREMLCMSKGPSPKPTCRERAQFDIWSHHPYTSGDATHKAFHPDDVSLGDLPEMKQLLRAAQKARHILAPRPVRFWVTEFSWDTSPPDPKAVPIRLQSRWVSEALYRMWQNGIDLVTWLQLRDGPYPGNDVQSGLWFRGGKSLRSDRAKPTLTAFRFPFVAYEERSGVRVWGRTPAGSQGTVAVEQERTRGRWVRLRALRSNRSGIFAGLVVPRSRGLLRARMLSGAERGTSLPFSLVRPPDRFVLIFG